MRFVALDVGDRRIGVAAGDSEFRTAFPKGVIERGRSANSDVARAVEACHAQEADQIIVGVPLATDGRETDRSLKIREFGERIGRASGLPVVYRNEALTTLKAEELMVAFNASRKTRAARGDAVAASVILQEFLDET